MVWTDAMRLGEASHRALMGPGAPYELTLDPTGVASPVFTQRPHSLGAVLDAAAERFGDRPCVKQELTNATEGA